MVRDFPGLVRGLWVWQALVSGSDVFACVVRSIWEGVPHAKAPGDTDAMNPYSEVLLGGVTWSVKCDFLSPVRVPWARQAPASGSDVVVCVVGLIWKGVPHA